MASLQRPKMTAGKGHFNKGHVCRTLVSKASKTTALIKLEKEHYTQTLHTMPLH